MGESPARGAGTGRGLEIDCQDLVELVTEYLTGTLAEPALSRFRDHLALCDGCDTYVEQIRATARLTGTISESSLTDPQRRRLLDAFRDWHRDQRH